MLLRSSEAILCLFCRMYSDLTGARAVASGSSLPTVWRTGMARASYLDTSVMLISNLPPPSRVGQKVIRALAFMYKVDGQPLQHACNSE